MTLVQAFFLGGLLGLGLGWLGAWTLLTFWLGRPPTK